ncbi:MAG: RNA polymerase subunit sigma, partial [Oscillibacter sp.]|nr:RNA polymerase subunit sigma [Oscillibacter sp.]
MEDMEQAYQRHARTVYKFLLAQCRDPGLAEELTQETFYQAVKSVDRFDGSCKV